MRLRIAHGGSTAAQTARHRRRTLLPSTLLLRRLRLDPEQAAVERALLTKIAGDLVRTGSTPDGADAVARRARTASVRWCRDQEEDEGMYDEGLGGDSLHALEQSASGRETLARLADLGVRRGDIVAWHDRSLVERRARLEVHRILLLDAFRAATTRGLPPNHAARVARRHHPRYACSVRTIDASASDPLLPREIELRVSRHVCATMEADRGLALAELRTYPSFNAWAWERIQIGWL